MAERKPRIPTDKIIAALRETNGLVSLAARRVPCSVGTINSRRRTVAEVRQVVDECREELVDLGELAMRRAIVAGEPWAVSLVLKTLGKHRGYVERQEVAGPDGAPIRVEHSYNDNELADILAGLAAAGALTYRAAPSGDTKTD